MKITKKLLAVILSALILVGAMPVVAVSAAEEFEADGFKYTTNDASATVTGYTGDATDIVIPAQLGGLPVETIGNSAFEGKEITSVTLPEGLKVIENDAFRDCKNLTGIVIPDTVKNVNGYAFSDCTALKTIELSSSLEYIGPAAFKATAVESVEIPKSLDKGDYNYTTTNYEFNGETISVNNGPFGLCDNLKTVTFEEGTTQIAEELFIGCTGLEEITLPETITVIESSAFEKCIRLKKIVIPENVTEIQSYAFGNCISLKDVTLNTNLTYLGNSAFRGTAIESIEIPRSLDKANYSYSTTNYSFNGQSYSVNDGPFALCENLKTVTFQKGTNQIAEKLFAGCTGLEEITIPDTVTAIETSAFEDCVRLKAIVIPDYVTSIGQSAFDTCASLEDIKLGASVNSIDVYAFANTPVKSVNIPASLDKGGMSYSTYNYTFNGTKYSFLPGPFVGCENLKTVTFEKGTDEISENLFAGCVGLEEIVIPEGVVEIEEAAFNGAVRLNKVILPSTLEKIGSEAFQNCSSIESFTVPETVTSVGKNAFRWCDNMTSFQVKNDDATLGEGVLADAHDLTDVKLPANLKVVSKYLFENAKSLEKVTIPATVEKIENYAFMGASSLDEAVIPEGVKEIGEEVFKNCTSLKSVNVPYSTDKLGAGAFYGCESLTDVKFEDYSIKTINENTFAECYALKEIKLPKGLQEIKGNAFVNCIELFDVTIPESVETIAAKILSYPGKTTIYSQTGSVVETYALDGGFKFVDAVTEIETIRLKDGATKLILEEDTVYKLDLDINPVDANECIKLTSSNDTVVKADGMELTTNWRNETVEIKAETLSGAVLTFEAYVRGIDTLRFVEGCEYQTQYATGDEFNPDGIRIEAVYSDGTAVEIQGFTFEGFDSSEVGKSKVFVKWTDDKGEMYEYYFYVEIIGYEPPKFQSQKDETTQIVVEAVTNATLSVVEITEKFMFDEVNLKLSGETVSKFFDITLVEDGVAVQPDGTVTVKIPCDDETAKVYRFEDDGTLTDMKAEFVDGFMVFTTEHFSYYVLASSKAQSLFDLGDANKDGKLNIRDATIIQKYLAKMVTLDEEAISLSDFDQNGKVNVKDATAIQKKLAGII